MRQFFIQRVEKDGEDHGKRQDREERCENEKEKYRNTDEERKEGKIFHPILIHTY